MESADSRGAAYANLPRRGRGVGRAGNSAFSDAGFDRFGKREFERHSGSDKTYADVYLCFANIAF